MKTNHFLLETQVGQLTPLNERSRRLRSQVVKIFSCSRRGHLGATFSLIEILSVLYDHILQYDPKNPKWPKRDRCILSKGHGCLALYVILSDKGFFPESELWRFCNDEGMLGGHPDYNKIPGVEASTGALGHGLSIGVGMAINGRYEHSDHRIFVILGDGECNEGSIWEAALSAGNRHLSNLCVLIDYNKQQSYDTTFSVQNLEPLAEKWRAFGFAVEEVDGHDTKGLKDVLSRVPLASKKPSAIICHTIKGKGISFAEKNLEWHHKNKITDEEIAAMLRELEVG
jgi:transketolase